MGELIQQVLTILRSMWKYRWLGLGTAWVVGLIGAGLAMRVPDKFEASARIFVDTQSILKPLMSGIAVQPNIEQQVMLLSRTLISRPNIEKLVRMADLDLGDEAKQQDALVDSLMKTLEIKTAIGRENIYMLAYRDQNPERAKKVIQSLVSIFIESSLGSSRKDSDAAKRFIDDQIAVYEKKLQEAESRLKEFKLRNIGVHLDDGKTAVGRVGEFGEQLNRARLDLREAESARDALKKQIFGDSQNPAGTELAVPELDARIEAQKLNLDNLLQKYTDLHPDVIGTRRVIRELEEQKRSAVDELRKAAASGKSSGVLPSGGTNSEIKRALANAEANAASLRTRVSEYESRYTRLSTVLKNEPQMEAELAQLNRDYAIHKKNYEDLVSRREAASLSGELESATGVADFRLIDPPSVSSKPVSPNRMLLLPLGLVAALVAGLVACFLASQIRPVFMDTKSLREVTGLPLLGSISFVLGPSSRIRESTGFKRFMAGLGLLVGVYTLGIVALFMISG